MKDPSRARVRGPLAPYAHGFVAELSRLGYTPVSATFQMQVMAHLSRWLEGQRLEVASLEPSTMAAFLAARRAEGYTGYLSAKALAPLLAYLRGLGVVPAAGAPVLSAAELLLACYRDYLTVERGLTAGTARGYVDLVRPFVASRVDGSGEVDLTGVTASEVLGFVLSECQRRPRRSAKLMVTALRSLLGYLHVEGLIARPLAPVVPSVASWRLAGVPPVWWTSERLVGIVRLGGKDGPLCQGDRTFRGRTRRSFGVRLSSCTAAAVGR